MYTLIVTRQAVAYTATPGYVFQTFVSASQARSHLPADVGVFVVIIASGASAEVETFAAAASDLGISVVVADENALEGHSIYYSRLFLGELLPSDVSEFLYVDGDTQVLGSLRPLLDFAPPPGSICASWDPMLLSRQLSSRFRSQIDQWWDESRISLNTRAKYINAGVLRFSRSGLASFRDAVLSAAAQSPPLQFRDQDALNLVLGDSLSCISIRWNFPGFLLQTGLDQESSPVLIHFMSNPRPWEGPFHPWGMEFHDVYAEFSARHPSLAVYNKKMSRISKVRYAAQQRLKRIAEGRLWTSAQAREAFRGIESTVVQIP